MIMLKLLYSQAFDQAKFNAEINMKIPGGIKFPYTMLKNNQYCSPKFIYFQIFDQAKFWW